MKLDDTVCFCYGVSLRKLINYIQRERPPVPSLVSRCLSAGTGCGWCVPFLKKLHQDVLDGRLDGLNELGFAEYERMRAEWLAGSKPHRDEDSYADHAMCRCASRRPAGETGDGESESLEPADTKDFT